MTAHAMNIDRERCLAGGMDGYLSKPIDPALLFAAVERGGHGARGSVLLTEGGLAIFDQEALGLRLGGDDELMDDVIQVFRDDLPGELIAIQAAVTGRDADAFAPRPTRSKERPATCRPADCSKRQASSSASAPSRAWTPRKMRGDSCRSKRHTSSMRWCVATGRHPTPVEKPSSSAH
jgi:hypothetical protein